MYGSHVYGTTHKNSDEDYIVIGGYESKELSNIDNNKNLKVFPLMKFLMYTEMHEVFTFECISLLLTNKNDMFKIYDDKFEKILKSYYNEVFNIIKLRKSFSQKSSNSFVKAQKKIILEDEDYFIGMKSLYHSLRILDFGYQIAQKGYIEDFKSCNNFWDDILKSEEQIKQLKTENDYLEFIQPWKKIYNELHSKFKAVTEK